MAKGTLGILALGRVGRVTRKLRIAKGILPQQTANELKTYAVDTLNIFGHFVWRQNNLHVQGRKFNGKRGVPDILGETKNGKILCVEVKAGRDKMSPDQVVFNREIVRRGGVYAVIGQRADVDILVEILEKECL